MVYCADLNVCTPFRLIVWLPTIITGQLSSATRQEKNNCDYTFLTNLIVNMVNWGHGPIKTFVVSDLELFSCLQLLNNI